MGAASSPRSMPSTAEYRAGWDRIFGARRGDPADALRGYDDDESDGDVECATCAGKGRVVVRESSTYTGKSQRETEMCRTCAGTGRLPGQMVLPFKEPLNGSV